MSKSESIFTRISGGSKQGNDAPIVRVTSRGGLRVDADELFKSSKVRQTIKKAAERDFVSRSSASATPTS